MKFKKLHIKQIIVEEIQTYMDEVIDNVGLEIEEEVPSDEEHLLSLLTKEFDRIPADRRRSVYTRFLSAANKYADRVSVATSPEMATAIQEEAVSVLTQEFIGEGIVLEEISKAQIEKVIRKFLMAAGIGAMLAGSGAAKAADAVADVIQQAPIVQTQQLPGRVDENHPGLDQHAGKLDDEKLYKKYKSIELTSGADAALTALHQDMAQSGFQDLVDDWANTPPYEWSEMFDTVIYYSNSKWSSDKVDGLIKVGLS
tara:strand:+ start:3590 stop:4357 length:768 start_codon:yes stop_codon:yes gene_type:complete